VLGNGFDLGEKGALGAWEAKRGGGGSGALRGTVLREDCSWEGIVGVGRGSPGGGRRGGGFLWKHESFTSETAP